MDAPSSPGRPAHVSAASGLVRLGHTLYVVADDELRLAAIPLAGQAPGQWLPLFPGELPLEHKARKAAKPDLEALMVLPPFPAAPHGALWAVPSGSTPNRRRGALLPLGEGGRPEGSRPVDHGPLYGALEAHLPALNLEGAAVVGDTLLLLQRGNGQEGHNALVRVDLAAVLGALAAGEPPPASALRDILPVDLGDLNRVPLSFTDASPLPDGRFAFTAAAEDTASTYHDGPCAGSVVGVMDLDGRVHSRVVVHPAEKLEGIHATSDAVGVHLLLVSDADDPAVPAVLRQARL